jgi:acetolactate synthase-1/2/3 large subunit
MAAARSGRRSVAYFGSANIGADKDTGLNVPNLSKVGASYGLGTYVIEDQTNLRAEAT